MAVFAVIATTEPERVNAAVIEQYGANHFRFSPTTWFVVDDGTSLFVSEKLGIADGRIGAQGAVLLFTGYSGYAAPQVWQWLRTLGSAVPNG